MRVAILFLLAAAPPIAILAWLVWRSRTESARLRRSLEIASSDLERLQLSFERFAPGEVVERIIARGVSTSAERKEVTVLFADIVGFTALSENLDPGVLVEILNGYFERMSRIISEHRGHVSKFIGDGILALFGAFERNPWQVNDSVHAALAMQETLRAYSRELAAAGLPELRAGIGLHSGVAVAGVIGSNELMEFTVMGNVVNLAARVERMTRIHGAEVLVTEAIRDKLDSRFVVRPLPPTPAHGISDPVAVYAVDSFAS
jgi:adenylate cyclase